VVGKAASAFLGTLESACGLCQRTGSCSGDTYAAAAPTCRASSSWAQGPIFIGQAAEFDYSGMQAVRALRDEEYRVILVNSNPATIMTDPNLADATYIEPHHRLVTPAQPSARSLRNLTASRCSRSARFSSADAI
jgi:hypothetical protein